MAKKQLKKTPLAGGAEGRRMPCKKKIRADYFCPDHGAVGLHETTGAMRKLLTIS
jgi:hypothetical protein